MKLAVDPIRDVVVERLRDRTIAGARVYPERAHAQWREELPAVSVYARRLVCTRFDEEPGGIGSHRQRCELDLACELHVRRKSGELAESIAGELVAQVIEHVDRLLHDPEPLPTLELDLLAAETGLDRVDWEYDGDAREIIGGVEVLYRITFLRSVPSTDELDELDEGKVAALSWTIGGKADAAGDTIDLATVAP